MNVIHYRCAMNESRQILGSISSRLYPPGGSIILKMPRLKASPLVKTISSKKLSHNRFVSFACLYNGRSQWQLGLLVIPVHDAASLIKVKIEAQPALVLSTACWDTDRKFYISLCTRPCAEAPLVK